MTGKQKRLLWRILGAAVLLAAAIVTDKLLQEKLAMWQVLLLYLPAYFAVGYDVLRRAGMNIVNGQIFDENLLMTVATVGALCIGFLPTGEPEFAEAVFVMIFYQTGELFQKIAVGKSRRSIAALMSIRPDTARVLRDGKETEVSPEEVAVGELISLRPGDRIPLDGSVIAGDSELDTAALTGEALPLYVTVGSAVYSGATNLKGALTVRVEKPFTQSTVSRILALVEDATEKKAKSERFISRFAKFYTPFVVISALLLAVLPPLFSGHFITAFPVWLARALTFLVISCPCALVISVPLSFFGGLGGASRQGILIKGASHLEQLAKVSVVAFDKTGTLTTGHFTVTKVAPLGTDKDTLLTLAAAAEQSSNHPLALALKNAVKSPLPPCKGLTEVAGRGVIAEIDGDKIAVGNLALMREVGVIPVAAPADGTALYVAKNSHYLGYILLADAPKPTAGEAMAALATVGVTRTVMLTGDREGAAAAVASALHISDCRAGLLPADKVLEIERLLSEPHTGTVAFVGDGINDAPVLSRADVGIAMGALGTDAAVEAADIVLMDDDPRKIAAAIRHARRTVSIVRQNIVLTLTIKAAVLLCSALGLLGALQMPLAIFADVGVSVLAILNAMRALRK